MTKQDKKNSNVPYVTRAHKQHNSLVTTIPKGVCVLLDIQVGDIVCFDVDCGKGVAEFRRQLKGAQHNERDKRTANKRN